VKMNHRNIWDNWLYEGILLFNLKPWNAFRLKKLQHDDDDDDDG